MPRPSALLTWSAPADISTISHYVVEYRQVLGGNQFGSWQVGASNVPTDRTSLNLDFPSPGTYQYRVTAHGVSGSTFLLGIYEVDISLRPGTGM